MNLFEKLLDIRKTTDYMQKTEKGNQGAMYVDPAVLLKKIRDKMNTHGILLFPKLNGSHISLIEAPTKNNPNNKGFLFTSPAQYTFIDSENPSDTLVVDWFMTGNHLQDPAMAEGGALTYSERYFLLKFFQIPTSKDDPEFFQEKTREPEPISKEQVSEIMDMLSETESDTEKFLKWMKVESVEAIPANLFNKALAALKAKGKK